MKPKPITRTEYTAFQTAYDFFNRELWNGALPDVLVTLQRKGNSRGYFHADRFRNRASHAKTDELALNPDYFTGRTDEQILSTLVHEMVHKWESFTGVQGAKGYHGREWEGEMLRVGLHPSSTEKPFGKTRGYKVSHYILPGRMFASACAKLKATGFKLNWQSEPHSKERKKKRESKTKYTCPECAQNAWAKPNAHLDCGDCKERLCAQSPSDG
jgi:predicted SprT family Zn-dependent metalloprotease